VHSFTIINGVPKNNYFVDGITDGIVAYGTTLAPSFAFTPLQATLPLFATGLGALCLLGWRRKRKGAAIAGAASSDFFQTADAACKGRVSLTFTSIATKKRLPGRIHSDWLFRVYIEPLVTNP